MLRRSFSTYKNIIQHKVCIIGGGPSGLITSALLSRYGIAHSIIERRIDVLSHPQAHFINSRTCEILQSYFPLEYNELLNIMSPVDTWRDFVYCNNMLGNELMRQDNREIGIRN